MAKQKLIEPEAPRSKSSLLAERLAKSFPGTLTAGELLGSYRYIDFCNPRSGNPTLAMEWLFGARGLWAGRLLNLIAKYSKGKSSFMYWMYACAQRLASGAWCCHNETEGAPAPPDFIASYGADPDDLLMGESRSLEEMMSWLDETEANIRGSWGTGSIDPATGRAKKSKFTDPFDADLAQPIVVGIDSISALGVENGAMMDVSDKTKTAQPGIQSKKLREYLSERNMRFKQRQVLLMLASHQTDKLDMGGGGMKAKGADVNCRAKEALGIYATYEITLDSKKWCDDKPPYTQYGDIVTIRTTKNKMAPRYREIRLYLRTGSGFDFTQTDMDWLTSNPCSPFVNATLKEKYGDLTTYGAKVTCKLLQEKPFATADEFLNALYANKELVTSMRRDLRMRGFGFDFETKYKDQLKKDGIIPEVKPLIPEDGVPEELDDGSDIEA